MAGSGSGVFPKPAYRPPCDGWTFSGRSELAEPRRSKKDSLPDPGSCGVDEREAELDGLSEEEPIPEEAPARDFRVAWEEAGREGTPHPGGGAEGDQAVGGSAHAATS